MISVTITAVAIIHRRAGQLTVNAEGQEGKVNYTAEKEHLHVVSCFNGKATLNAGAEIW